MYAPNKPGEQPSVEVSRPAVGTAVQQLLYSHDSAFICFSDVTDLINGFKAINKMHNVFISCLLSVSEMAKDCCHSFIARTFNQQLKSF